MNIINMMHRGCRRILQCFPCIGLPAEEPTIVITTVEEPPTDDPEPLEKPEASSVEMAMNEFTVI